MITTSLCFFFLFYFFISGLYLYIYHYDVQLFVGITSFYHLRILHAEYNKVTSCHPLKRMKGLIHLNLRNNSIDHLSFQKTKM